MTQLVIRHYQQPAARRQLWLGLLMAAVAGAYLLEQSAQWLNANPMAAKGLVASLGAGLATGLGAVPLLFMRRTAPGLMAPMLGMAGGMMLAASFFSLLWPAIGNVLASPSAHVLAVASIAALFAGAAGMHWLDHRLPHEHVETVSTKFPVPHLSLVVAAVAIHNVPEGLAVGAAAAAGVDHGMSLGIAMQNIPEGWIVASALLALGVGPLRAAMTALATGLVEPVGGLFGAIASTRAGAALPIALSAAAGAMIWVVVHELLPTALAGNQKRNGMLGIALGFMLMSALSLAL